MSKKKLLISGSGGFIFSNFTRYVLKNYSNKYDVVGIDRCNDSNVLNTIYSNKGHTFYIGDITDDHFIDVIFQLERPDVVVHAAAESFVDSSIIDPNGFVKTNVLGTQVVINKCLKYNVEKMIMISTDEVYGHLLSDDSPSWSEDSIINPRNTYSSSKASAEMLVKAAGETHGLKYNITRSCNNFGPRQPRRNLIPVIISNILEKKKVPIYGKGMQIRDWIYVQDKCSAILKIIEKAPNKEIYNISAKQELRNVEMFQEICNILGEGHDLIEFVEDRKGHDFRYSVDNSKLLNLGWSPSWKFKDALAMTCKWYKDNKWFCNIKYMENK